MGVLMPGSSFSPIDLLGAVRSATENGELTSVQRTVVDNGLDGALLGGIDGLGGLETSARAGTEAAGGVHGLLQ